MAGIDRTYCSSYTEYKAFKEWADQQTITFYDGYTVCVGDWVSHREPEHFEDGAIAIMNTPTWLDVYLIQNCPSAFVLERMREVYFSEEYEAFKTVDLSAPPPPEFQQNRKIKIRPHEWSRCPLHSKPYGRKKKWWLQCDGYFMYHDETKKWVHSSFHYPYNTSTVQLPSVKSVVRHLRKQHLPKGVTFYLSGALGQYYTVVVG